MKTEFQDLYYNVSDMKKAVDFYCGLLGMQYLDGDEYWTSLSLDGVKVGLHWTGGASVEKIPYDAHGAYCGATLTLRVEDIQLSKQELQENDVEIIGFFDEPWGEIIVFKDPSGNLLKLMKPKY